MEYLATLRQFKRALLSLVLAVLVLAVSVGNWYWQVNSSMPEPISSRPPSKTFFDASQTRLLKKFAHWTQQYQWYLAQQPHSIILSDARKRTDIDRIEYQVYADRYLWLLADTPDSFRVDGVEISMRLDHGQQFLDWLAILRQNALAFPLSCRLYRGKSDNFTEFSESDLTLLSKHPPSLAVPTTATTPTSLGSQIGADCDLLWLSAVVE